MADLVDEVRAALRKQRQERGITETAQAVESDMSPTGFNDFMCGDRSLGPRTWRALYRTHPELRWLLEEYQRREALAEHDEEAGTVAAQRR